MIFKFFNFEFLIQSNVVFVLVDNQVGFMMGVCDYLVVEFKYNIVGFVFVVKVFGLLIVIMMMLLEIFWGLVIFEFVEVFFEQIFIDWISVNVWDDLCVVVVIEVMGWKKLIFVGLLFEVCVVFFVMCVV